MLLRKESVGAAISAFKKELSEDNFDTTVDQDYLSDVKRAKIQAEVQLVEIEQAVQQTQSDFELRTEQVSESPLSVPSKTRRVREMLLEEMDMPQGSDAYHRLSGVAHSETLAIIDTWNLHRGKPSINYFDFLVYLHLAVCSIDFALERRATCWGEGYLGARLQKIIMRLEGIIAGEPEVLFC